MVGREALQAPLDARAERSRPPVGARPAAGVPALGEEVDTSRRRAADRLADQLLAVVVALRGVDHVEAGVERAAEQARDRPRGSRAGSRSRSRRSRARSPRCPFAEPRCSIASRACARGDAIECNATIGPQRSPAGEERSGTDGGLYASLSSVIVIEARAARAAPWPSSDRCAAGECGAPPRWCGVALTRVARAHHQLGLDAVDVGARVRHDAVVALLDAAPSPVFARPR